MMIDNFILLISGKFFYIFMLDSHGDTRAPCASLQYPLKSSHVPNQGTGKCSE